MLKREGPQEWFHNENKNISAMKFRFKDKGSPLDYVYKLSSHLIVSHNFTKLSKSLKIFYFIYHT